MNGKNLHYIKFINDLNCEVIKNKKTRDEVSLVFLYNIKTK